MNDKFLKKKKLPPKYYAVDNLLRGIKALKSLMKTGNYSDRNKEYMNAQIKSYRIAITELCENDPEIMKAIKREAALLKKLNEVVLRKETKNKIMAMLK